MAGKPDEGPGSELSPIARQMRAAQPYMAAVWKLVGGAMTGVLGGYWLDRWLGTGPWLLVGLATLGIGVGFYAFLKSMLDMGRKKQ
jgi:ATP synthase protein I